MAFDFVEFAVVARIVVQLVLIILGHFVLHFLVQLITILLVVVCLLVIDGLVVLARLRDVHVVTHLAYSLLHLDLAHRHGAVLRVVILLIVASHLPFITALLFFCICVNIDFPMRLFNQVGAFALHLLVEVQVFLRLVLVDGTVHLVQVLVGSMLAGQVLLKLPIWVAFLH